MRGTQLRGDDVVVGAVVVSYEKQLAFKDRKVKNNLIRIGGFAPDFVEEIMEAPVGMEHPFHYRNKAQFPVGMDKNGRLIAGFYAGRTHTIIENRDCALGVEENKIVLDIVLDFCTEKKIPAYDETTGKGLLRHVLIRKGFSTGQIMVCLILNGSSFAAEQELADRLFEKVPGMTSFSVNSNFMDKLMKTMNFCVPKGLKLFTTAWTKPLLLQSLSKRWLHCKPIFIASCCWNNIEMGVRGPSFVQMDDSIVDGHIIVSFVKIAYIARQGFPYLLLFFNAQFFPISFVSDGHDKLSLQVQIFGFLDVFIIVIDLTIFALLFCVVSVQCIIEEFVINIFNIAFENLDIVFRFFSLDMFVSVASKFLFCQFSVIVSDIRLTWIRLER